MKELYEQIEAEMRKLYSKIMPIIQHKNEQIYNKLKNLVDGTSIKNEKELRVWIGGFRDVFYNILSLLPIDVQRDVKILNTVIIEYLKNYNQGGFTQT